MAASQVLTAQNANPMAKETDTVTDENFDVAWGSSLQVSNPMQSIQDQENPDLDTIQHVEMVAHDTRAGREEQNDGLHLVTVHFLLSPKTSRRQKYAWFAGSGLLLFVQMLTAISVMLGSFIPKCVCGIRRFRRHTLKQCPTCHRSLCLGSGQAPGRGVQNRTRAPDKSSFAVAPPTINARQVSIADHGEASARGAATCRSRSSSG
jgi:hypothetical protein